MFNNKKDFRSIDLLLAVLGEDECMAKYQEINGLTAEAIQTCSS